MSKWEWLETREIQVQCAASSKKPHSVKLVFGQNPKTEEHFLKHISCTCLDMQEKNNQHFDNLHCLDSLARDEGQEGINTCVHAMNAMFTRLMEDSSKNLKIAPEWSKNRLFRHRFNSLTPISHVDQYRTSLACLNTRIKRRDNKWPAQPEYKMQALKLGLIERTLNRVLAKRLGLPKKYRDQFSTILHDDNAEDIAQIIGRMWNVAGLYNKSLHTADGIQLAKEMGVEDTYNTCLFCGDTYEKTRKHLDGAKHRNKVLEVASLLVKLATPAGIRFLNSKEGRKLL